MFENNGEKMQYTQKTERLFANEKARIKYLWEANESSAITGQKWAMII